MIPLMDHFLPRWAWTLVMELGVLWALSWLYNRIVWGKWRGPFS